MTGKNIPIPGRTDLGEQYDDLIVLEPRDEYDRCILGTVQRFNDRFVLYSKSCVLRVIYNGIPKCEDRYEQAIEWFEFNTVGGWYGETTPAFLEDVDA